MNGRPLYAAVIVLALCVCCSEAPKISPFSESSVILAFGDSITAGTGAPDGESYPALLQQLTGRKVINAGVPGEFSAEGVQRLPLVLDMYSPNLVILCHGGNDILQKIDEERTIQNIRSMIEVIRSRGSDVILIGVPKPGLGLRAAPFYKEIAREYGIPYEQRALANILSTPALKSDYVHPNAEGYKKLAESVAALIRQSQSQ